MTGPVSLARRTLSYQSLWVFGVGASSPLTVLVGGITAMYALTGVTGVPVAFLVVGASVALLAVGYVAMSRHISHPAPFYAQLARISPALGVAAAAVSLLGYSAIGISLYALLGVTMAGLMGGSWVTWAVVVWVLIAILGRFRGVANARFLGGLLLLELLVIVLFDIAAISTGEWTWEPLNPSNLFVPGVSGALAFAMAAFVGTETPPAFAEEARERAVGKATFYSIGFAAVFYAVSAWAFAMVAWPGGDIATAAADPANEPLKRLGDMWGSSATWLATFLLVTSVLAAISAFHSTASRYTFALARERVLPKSWARVSTGATGGAPLGGSLVQSAIAALVVACFVIADVDPMATMFTWLSTIAAVSILLLLVAASMAARSFFARGGGSNEGPLVRAVIPTAASLVGVLVIMFMAGNLGSLLGTPEGSRLPWLVPMVIIAVAGAGLGWGVFLRLARPEVYARIGRGAPEPLAVADDRLSTVEV